MKNKHLMRCSCVRENAAKDVNTRKGNRLPHEAGLKLIRPPRAPHGGGELPVTHLLRNAHGIVEWELFLKM